MKKAKVVLYARFAHLDQLSGETQAKVLKTGTELAGLIAEQGSAPVESQLVQAVIEGKANKVLVQREDMFPAAVVDTIARHGGQIECIKDYPALPER